MLNDDDKIRIQFEESYRTQVRKQAEKEAESKKKLWAFVNSRFGIWLRYMASFGHLHKETSGSVLDK